MNFLKSTKSILAVLLVICLMLVCGCSGSADDTSSDNSTVGNNSVVSSTQSDTSSKNTVSKLTDDQIAMTQHLGKWSDKIDTVNAARKGTFTFLVETDTHHYDTTINFVGKNAAAFSNFVELDFIANLGDLVRGYSQDEIDNPENMRACMDDIVYRFTNRTKCPVFMTVGNHDTNKMWCEKWADHTAQFTPEEQYQRVYAPLKEHNGDKMITDDDGSYYYMDFPEDKVRVVMLNTSNDFYDGTRYSGLFKISDKQVEWFKTEALNTTNSVLVMMHVPLIASFPDNGNSVTNSSVILAAVEEFISGGGQFIAYMSGHTHAQHELVDDNGRLHISFKNGGTNGEVVMIDLNDGYISTVGLGSAKDREFRYR